MTIQNDNFSAELIQILETLSNDINRKLLQMLYDCGQTELQKLSDHLGIESIRSISMRLAQMERLRIVLLEHDSTRRRIVSVKLTPFAQILLQSLFFVQIMLEDKS